MRRNSMGFPFLPVPEAVKKAIREKKLKSIDGIVLGMMLRQRGLTESCSARNCTRRKIGDELGKGWQVIYRSFVRLKTKSLGPAPGVPWIEHYEVPIPDPDDPHNSTGYRIRFPWINRECDRITTPTTRRFRK